MTRYPPRYWAVAAGLSALAGCVDAIGFVKLGGLFVSFMSGNTTRLAVGAVEGAHMSGGMMAGAPVALVAAALIASFVGGAVAGFLVGARFDRSRAPVLLGGVMVLLLAAALLDGAALPAAMFVMAAAMGAENAVFERDGEVAIGLTYMTGTLVKFAQRLATALRGGPRWDWLPFLLLWAGLVAGAFVGAMLAARWPHGALWAAAGAAGTMALVVARLDRSTPGLRSA